MTLKHTREIRAIMREAGAATIYTNKHKTCRSLKCYQFDVKSVAGLVRKLKAYVADNNLIGVYLHSSPTRGGWCYSAPSITVRIPLE